MKTIVTFLIALLAFASTVAWAGQPAQASTATTANAEASGATSPQRAASRPGAAGSKRGAGARAVEAAKAGRSDPAADFRIELPDAPAVFCACVSQRRLG